MSLTRARTQRDDGRGPDESMADVEKSNEYLLTSIPNHLFFTSVENVVRPRKDEKGIHEELGKTTAVTYHQFSFAPLMNTATGLSSLTH